MFEKSELEVRLDQLEEVVFLRLERLEKIVKTKEAKSAAQVEAAITVKDHASKAKLKRKQKSRTKPTPPTENPQWMKNLTDVEWLTSRIGISLLLIGIVTMLFWLNDQLWVTDGIRLGTGYGAGAILLGLGLWLSEKRPSFGQLLAGGGIACGYMTTFWGSAFLETIPDLVALVIVFGVTMLAYGISVWKKQPALAFVGLLFGLACPFFIRPENASMVSYIAYTCVILLGPIAIYTTLSWNHLFMLTSTLGWIIMIGSSVLVESSTRFTYDERLAVQGGIIFAYIGFGIVPVVKLVLERAKLDPAEILVERARNAAAETRRQGENGSGQPEQEANARATNRFSWPDWMPMPLPLIVVSPIVASVASLLLWPNINSSVWAAVMALGGFVYFAAVYRFGRDARFQIIQFPLLIVGGVLLLLAPLQTNINLIPLLLITSSIQAVSFAAYAQREHQTLASYFAFALYVFAAVVWCGLAWEEGIWGRFEIREIESPIFNLNFVAILIFIFSLVGGSFLEKGWLKPTYAAVAYGVALFSIGHEIFALDQSESYWLLFAVLFNLAIFAAGYFLNRRYLQLQVIPIAIYVAFTQIGLSLGYDLSLPNLMLLLLAIQILVICAAAKKGEDYLVTIGGNLLAAMGGAATLVQFVMFILGNSPPDPFISPYHLSPLAMIISLSIVACWYSQKPMNMIIGLGAHFLALIWIVIQCVDFTYFGAMITALWALYAVVLLILGLVFDRKAIRNLGVVTILLTVSKLILVDLDYVAIGGRVLLFSGFGVVLLVISYFTRTLWRQTDPDLNDETDEMIETDLKAMIRNG